MKTITGRACQIHQTPHPKTILVVEDHQQAGETTSATLKDLGYKVLEAEDGSSAFELFRQRPGYVELVLGNVIMPNGMSGVKLAKQIAVEHPHLKTLATPG